MNDLIMAVSQDEVDMSKYFELFNSDYDMGSVFLVALFGILLVIAILIVLIVLLTLFNKVFTGLEKKATKSVAKTDTAPIAEASTEEDEETVAAIMAAITCIYAAEGDGEPAPFIVRRIRQVQQIKEKR